MHVMKRWWHRVLGLTALAVLLVPTAVGAQGASVPFKDARLKIEYNATDGDAGIHINLDHEPWKSISITDPSGKKIVDVAAGEVIANYGLTELFSESSEPPFEVFPFEEFKKLFPAGTYHFNGETIEGTTMASDVPFTHNVPGAPQVSEPKEDFSYDRDEVVVKWSRVNTPRGIQIAGYQVVVVAEKSKRTFQADLPASARSIEIPPEFLRAGTHVAEVLAVERGGNQTLTSVTFAVR